MFCPRCGAESDEGSRYCASCGAELPKSAVARGEVAAGVPSFGERIGRLVGSSRRARLATAGTAAAIVVALIAFFALDSSSDEAPDVPQDGYTKRVDAACVQRKLEIAKAQRAALSGGGPAVVARYADSIVPIAGEWRMELASDAVPIDRAEPVEALGAALLEVEIEAGSLARVAREADSRKLQSVAARVDAATGNVEVAIDSLGLERCGRLTVNQGQLVSQ